ncbi:MAG: N-acetylmuramoyl-L-alanine amidase [Alistipes sp.]|nr:N-acetylmuramoyl-L-alanine amidase [Alistipes sp.]
MVIDAGHGGNDPGAVGRIYKEKDINLDVALQLGALIRKNYPSVKVVYTRDKDVFIPLYDRGKIANRVNADLFISIHVNSNTSHTPSGTSTYVMGVDKTGKSLDVAMKENDVITYEEDYSTKYQGYVPGSAESFIIFSFTQFTHQTQSITLADMVQKQFGRSTSLPNRGVNQAGFLVLWYASMPSILAEFGFISNPTEERYIGSDKGRSAYARCLFNAFSEYKTRCEGRGTAIVAVDTPPSATEDSSSTSESTSESTSVAESSSVERDEPRENTARGSVTFRVQVATADHKLPKNASLFGPYRGRVTELIVGRTYKYYVGETTSYEEALSVQRQVRQSIRDAFLVAFEGDTPISMEEARRR